MSILFDANTQETLQKTIDISKSYSHEYVTPEHLLLSLIDFSPFALTVRHVNGYPEYIKEDLMNYLDAQEKVDREVKEGEEELSVQMEMLLNESLHTCQNANRDYITLPIIVQSLMNLENSFAANILVQEIGGEQARASFLSAFISRLEEQPYEDDDDEEEPMDDFLEENPARSPYLTDMNKALSASSPQLIGREAELRRTIQER